MEDKARLLFVDDEERIVNLLRMMFRSEYEVHTATSGRQALEIIAAHPIDVIVSDQRMPGMLGIELLSQVRERSPATMRLLLTGYADLSAIIGSVNEGEVFRFINKPWNHEEIKVTIAAAAKAARASGEAAGQAAPEQPLPEAADRPELLLLDDSTGDREQIEEIFGAVYKIHGASSIPAALEILAQHNIGVIVAEPRVGGADTGQLLRILKQHYPSITTVILTKTADADLVIKLINGAQIFRFVTKPIRATVFELAVAAAMREHLRLRTSPALATRHRVAPASEPDNASLVTGVMQSLSRFRSRFSRAAG